MIQAQTILKIADNTGAKVAQCIKVLGGSRRRYAQIGDVVVIAVKKADPRRDVKRHQVLKAVIVRQKKPFKREDGTYLRFDENAAVIVNDKGEPRGGRIFGPIPKELKEKGFDKITNLAKDVI